MWLGKGNEKAKKEEAENTIILPLPDGPSLSSPGGRREGGFPTGPLHSYHIPSLTTQSCPRFLPTSPLVQC